METMFVPELPADAVKSPGLPVALGIITRRPQAAKKVQKAVIRVLTGAAEHENYQFSPASGRICIGRDKRAQSADGFLRENNIAFPSSEENNGNRFVSRAHAHIEFDQASGHYVLFADEGGIPPRNKIKVQRGSGEQIRLQTVEVGHHLQPGDRIVLGESVLLEFDYLTEEA
jgi:pSer/pThr/pTyr-binding forkhead associated (FHA) protein